MKKKSRAYELRCRGESNYAILQGDRIAFAGCCSWGILQHLILGVSCVLVVGLRLFRFRASQHTIVMGRTKSLWVSLTEFFSLPISLCPIVDGHKFWGCFFDECHLDISMYTISRVMQHITQTKPYRIRFCANEIIYQIFAEAAMEIIVLSPMDYSQKLRACYNIDNHRFK